MVKFINSAEIGVGIYAKCIIGLGDGPPGYRLPSDVEVRQPKLHASMQPTVIVARQPMSSLL